MRRFGEQRRVTTVHPAEEDAVQESDHFLNVELQYPPELGAEEKRRVSDDLDWRLGASDYEALRCAEQEGAPQYHGLARAEEGRLESMAKLFRTEPLVRNHLWQQQYNRGQSSPEESRFIEQRLDTIMRDARSKYTDVARWLPSVLLEAKPTADRPLAPEQRRRIGGFGMAALEDDQYRIAFNAFEAAGLLNDQGVIQATQQKAAQLERTHESALIAELEQCFSRLEIHKKAA